MRRVIASLCFAASFVVACSDSDQTKIDYSIRYTDINNVDMGDAVTPATITSLQNQNMTNVMLKGSSATLNITSDAAGLHFAIFEGMMRRGVLTCTTGKGSGVAQANAQTVDGGGHYLIKVSYKDATCGPEQ